MTCCCASTPARHCHDENRMRYGSDQFYVRAPEEMYQPFPGHDDAVARSQEIADGVDIRARLQGAPFPRVCAAGRKDAGEVSARTVRARACRNAIGRRAAGKPVADRLESRTGHHLPDGFRQLFPDRLGFRAVCPRERHSRHAPAAPAAGRSSPTSLISAMSARWNTTCCSSDSSTRTGPKRPISTSTFARTAARS